MSQCHDIYSWDTYHGGHWVAPEGTQCHDSDERQAAQNERQRST